MPDLQPSLIRLDGDFAPVRRVVELLRDAGGRPLLVGGCVRDALMKVSVLDVDIEAGRATGESYWTLLASGPGGGAALTAFGRASDVFVKGEQGWRIERRIAVADAVA